MLLFFDYADPLSWAVEVLARRAPSDSVSLERFPFESEQTREEWSARTARTGELLEQLGVPWVPGSAPVKSQKAFELAFHAAEQGCFDLVHAAIFEAHFTSGRDIGRIDELVEVAQQTGLDPSETKAVLDVDRYAEAVSSWLSRARAAGIAATPTLSSGTRRLEGLDAVSELERIVGLEPRED